MTPRVAVIGLGNIGGGVARNLARAGYEVHAVDLDPAKVAGVTAVGGLDARSAANAASHADVVFTSLPGPTYIVDVGAQILQAMEPDSIWVELSTNDLETAKQLGADCRAAKVRIIDAPVSGGPEGAEAGTLSVFVGGAPNDVEQVLPLLNVIGSKIDHLCAHGAGIVAKIAQVTLCYTQTVTLVEALILGVKGGIEPHKMLDLIQNSAGRSYVSDTYGPEILAGTYDASFPISHAAKDMRLAMDLARSVDASLPFMAAVAELYERTEAKYGPTAAHLLAAQLIEKQNDVILHKEESQQ